MNIREKFENIILDNNDLIPTVNECEKLTYEFAIKFADWLEKLPPSKRVSFWSKNGEHKGKFDMDNEQLLETFKNEIK